MESSLRHDITCRIFDEYFKEGEIADFAALKALWDVIDPSLMSYKVKHLKGGYKAFLKSVYWKTVSDEAKRRADYGCQLCNSMKELNVHHRCYDHLGIEILHMNDLVCLCHKCHEHHHKGYEKIQNLENEIERLKDVEKENQEYLKKINHLESCCLALKEARPLINPQIPSDKAVEYFSRMNEDELRSKCMSLYDTFIALRDYQNEIIDLKEELYYIKNNIPSEKWQRPEWFDYPEEDEKG